MAEEVGAGSPYWIKATPGLFPTGCADDGTTYSVVIRNASAMLGGDKSFLWPLQALATSAFMALNLVVFRPSKNMAALNASSAFAVHSVFLSTDKLLYAKPLGRTTSTTFL